MRPGSGRLGTGQQEVNYGGVGLNTNVNIADRPVTQQGMAGLRTASAGKGRQVQDVSYYLGLLRTKMGELQTEIQRLHSEAERRKKEETQQQQVRKGNAILFPRTNVALYYAWCVCPIGFICSWSVNMRTL